MLSKDLLLEAQNLQSELIQFRRYLHAHPEIGFDLSPTRSFVESQLSSMGYQPKDCGRSGIVVTIGNKKKDKTFLIRGDMDALPIREDTDLDFSSSNGYMHACGHDMHTAMLLGAAKILKAHETEINGTIKLMFQPAEEILEGAKDMIDAGVLHKPDVDAALMIHVMSGVPFPAGTVIVSSAGSSAPAADYFRIFIKGKGCHGSTPNAGIDPLNAASHILIAVQEIASRELSFSDKAVLTFGSVHGGTASNIIPDFATMSGSMRTYDEKLRTYIKQRLCEIASGIASTFRCNADVTFSSSCPTLINDKNLCVSAEKYLKEIFEYDTVYSAASLNAGSHSGSPSGSEDFAYVSQEVPSVMIAIAAGSPEDGYLYPLHHPKVNFDENVLHRGSALYAYTAMRWLEEHS